MLKTLVEEGAFKGLLQVPLASFRSSGLDLCGLGDSVLPMPEEDWRARYNLCQLLGPILKLSSAENRSAPGLLQAMLSRGECIKPRFERM